MTCIRKTQALKRTFGYTCFAALTQRALCAGSVCRAAGRERSYQLMRILCFWGHGTETQFGWSIALYVSDSFDLVVAQKRLETRTVGIFSCDVIVGYFGFDAEFLCMISLTSAVEQLQLRGILVSDVSNGTSCSTFMPPLLPPTFFSCLSPHLSLSALCSFF